jgi:hypothetical protein
MVRMHGEECTAISFVLKVIEHHGLAAGSSCESQAHLLSSSFCSLIGLFQVRRELASPDNQVALF